MKDSSIRFKRRLLNVARALRESKDPNQFSMEYMSTVCGTPGCALGHYASRCDLQKTFLFIPGSGGCIRYRMDHQRIGVDSLVIATHFGLCESEVDDLFSSDGCENASSTIEAAEFIEDFVGRKYRSTQL